jgi:hypothetical protein
MAATMPLTLLTLPLEIRQIIWGYCLVSPTRRVLPVYYSAEEDFIPSFPITWMSIGAIGHARGGSYAAARCSAFSRTLHLIPCALTSATPHSLSRPPLPHYLPRVNRQLYDETSTRLWSKNTFIFPDYATAKELLEHLGKISLRVQRVELVIGNMWDLRAPQLEKMTETLNELLRLVHEGQLGKLRLRYFDGGACNRNAFNIWMGVLHNIDKESDWGRCEREVVWGENGTKTNKLRQMLARQRGLEGRWAWDEEWDRWDGDITDMDWMPTKQEWDNVA